MNAREHLLGANSRVSAARTRLEAVKNAVNRAWTDRGEANRKMNELEEALAAAEAKAPAIAVTAFIDGGDDLDSEIEKLHADLAQAKRAAQKFERLRQDLDREQTAAEAEVYQATLDQKKAIGGILRESPNVARLIQRHAAARATTMGLWAALDAIQSMGGISQEHQGWEVVGTRVGNDTRLTVTPDPGPLARWAQALDALADDADAKLPD
jgi:septal ring factor EnvC (AmiA/AmiB activator)